jgi:hypothetical protein
MKTITIFALAAWASSGAIAAGLPNASARVTSKSADQFVGCFVAAQQRESMPWWFVPKAGGGTISNLGAVRDSRAAYFVAVSDRGSRREVRIEQVVAGSPVASSVIRDLDRCI